MVNCGSSSVTFALFGAAPDEAQRVRFPMSLVFRWLEPFAKPLWHREISSFAPRPDGVTWRKTPHFGGLYQTVVASRPRPAENHRRTT